MTALSTVCPDTPAPPQASAYSRFVQRIRRRYAQQMPLLPAGAPLRAGMQTALDALLASGLETGAALRVLRQLVLERLVALDCDGNCENQAPLRVVTQAMTELAELALDVAMRHSSDMLDAAHGAPQAESGGRAQMWVVGMGKLGARELNVSSDIDLIYVYDHDGETAGRSDGRGQISNHEYFARQVRAVFSLIGDVTEHGFVFRVDLALRPNGNSGPAAISLSALEDYFQAQGREWERFAWLKSRVVSPLEGIRSGSAQALRGSVLPFVFRRYLDY
ncbi:MAG: glutamine-synthetase adenylyltransferase, partial [Polaromonas sp.]|nr:glutamine-synthetase adenylyltransferase [Polaromonas sp.]